MDTSQSNSAYTINDSSVGDDDVNDIIELEEEIEKGLRPVEQKAPRQRKLTSQVWSLFRKVSGDKYPDNKPRAVCKKCSIEYVAVRNSDTGTTELVISETRVNIAYAWYVVVPFEAAPVVNS
ncbi:hypothetical protein WN944_001990 [Citrus x changshan-huyou]|uniref:Uncharacterized protein n=1 Tax=Citrus x changshan-huyou TaxID=2935761 RepID=A0AAP0QVD1_9ROSI